MCTQLSKPLCSSSKSSAVPPLVSSSNCASDLRSQLQANTGPGPVAAHRTTAGSTRGHATRPAAPGALLCTLAALRRFCLRPSVLRPANTRYWHGPKATRVACGRAAASRACAYAPGRVAALRVAPASGNRLPSCAPRPPHSHPVVSCTASVSMVPPCAALV